MHASVTAIFMSETTDASKSSASAMPASACRTTPTPSGRAGMVSNTSGRSLIRSRRSSARAAIASSRWRSTGSTGHEARDVEDPLDARLHGLADADDEALVCVERAAPRVEQRAEHGGVDERRGRQVHDDPAATVERLFKAFAQRRGGVDVVLSFDDDDHDIPRGVVEHDGVGFHTGMQDTRSPAA